MFLQGRWGWGHRQVGPTAAAAMEMATRLPFGCLWGLQTLLLQLLGCFCASWPREMLAKAEAASFWGCSGEPNPAHPHPAPGWGRLCSCWEIRNTGTGFLLKEKEEAHKFSRTGFIVFAIVLYLFLILLCKDVACPRLSNHKAW